MFSFLRYVYGVSFVLIVIGAISVGMVVRSIMSEGLELAVMRNNSSLTQSYINSVWRPYTPHDAIIDSGQSIKAFMEHSRLFVHQMTASRFAVYDATGKRLFTSHTAEMFDNEGQTVGFSTSSPAMQGKVSARLIGEAQLFDEQGKGHDRAIIQTLHPITNPYFDPQNGTCKQTMNPCGPVMGVVEVLTDISPQWSQLNTIQIVSVVSIIGIFIILISILMFTTQRAEAIIAKQHEINLELTAAAATAEAENRDKSQFLANISHELRTPLNAIIGFSEIIKKEALEHLKPAHQEYIRDIHGSGIHLLSLINDILDFSKAEAGKLELDLTEIDINKLVINSMRLVIPRAENAQVTLVEDLPSEHVICMADGKKLKQVLLNLLSNAVKFTPAGGEVRVSAWEQLMDNKICIQVRDTGIGIAPKDIAKVMMPFGQVDNKLSRKYEGTGLGLPLSKKFVEIMGGEFHIESEVDVGTMITLKLPGAAKSNQYDLKRD
jgi:two-component system cell cycle sensor histidine kinase PleC